MREEYVQLTVEQRHDLAFDYFLDELDGYLQAIMDDGYTWDEAVAEAFSEYDEFWRACLDNYGAINGR